MFCVPSFLTRSISTTMAASFSSIRAAFTAFATATFTTTIIQTDICPNIYTTRMATSIAFVATTATYAW
ncbi:hypothetical protein K7432_008863 [Basidiobolus ranarum]|uniref:Uncharacterized protein n=1 Tax=Basidiobolus ranarum TaxID=34480 RepID=A0ABR2WR66_9FUNG